MSDSPSREETRAIIDDKLAVVEARLDGRFGVLEAKLDNLVTNTSALRDEVKEVKADNRNTRWTIVGTLVLATLAAVGLVYSVQTTLLTAFTAGLAAIAAHH